MALYLPALPIERLIRLGEGPADERPFALYAKSGNAFRLTALDAKAQQAGLSLGLSLADARAMRPDLVTRTADPAADLRLLDHVAAWCERFTPIVVLDRPDGLFLDVTGCAHLFGGEAKLGRAVLAGLAAQGFQALGAIAPNPAAAWACVRFSKARLVSAEKLDAVLSPLPLAALRLAPAAEALLKRFGLTTIGQILHAPRQPFSARAGQQALLRLDQAMGAAPEALSPRRPPPPLFAVRILAEPILSLEAVLHVATDLCADLSAKLDERGQGTRAVELRLFGLDHKTRAVQIGFGRPERDPKIMLRLLRERLSVTPENLAAETGFEALRLDAISIAPIRFQATDLAPTSLRDPGAEGRVIDTIRARLGDGRIGHFGLQSSHAPERASQWTAHHAHSRALNTTAQQASAPPIQPPQDGVMRRPLCLFNPAQPIDAMAAVPDGPPARFRWRRVLHEVARAEGPERLAPNWLRAPNGIARDYYRVEDQKGRRFWLYREGLYGEDTAPRWFMHGLFP